MKAKLIDAAFFILRAPHKFGYKYHSVLSTMIGLFGFILVISGGLIRKNMQNKKAARLIGILELPVLVLFIALSFFVDAKLVDSDFGSKLSSLLVIKKFKYENELFEIIVFFFMLICAGGMVLASKQENKTKGVIMALLSFVLFIIFFWGSFVVDKLISEAY